MVLEGRWVLYKVFSNEFSCGGEVMDVFRLGILRFYVQVEKGLYRLSF